jgi:hypothetical protein
MATASRQVRKIRRIKRERSIAFRALKLVAAQRDYAIEMLKKANTAPVEPTLKIETIEGESLMDAPDEVIS